MLSRRLFVLLALLVMTTASYFGSGVHASRQQLTTVGAGAKKSLKVGAGRFSGAAQVRPGSYLSPASRHKLLIESTDREQIDSAMSAGAVELADYGSFKVFGMDERAVAVAAESSRRNTIDERSLSSLRDDLNVLLLRSATIDTTTNDAPGAFVADNSSLANVANGDVGSGLRLIQFVGPVKRDWLNKLKNAGLEPIAYVPNNAYLVRAGSGNFSASMMSLSRAAGSDGVSFVQWVGPFLDSYKIHPKLADQMSADPLTEVSVAIQMMSAVNSKKSRTVSNQTMRAVTALSSSLIGSPYQVLGFTNLRLRIPAGAISQLAAIPDVINLEPWNPPHLLDELSNEILANNLTDDGKQAKSPGYMNWLAAHGFTGRFGFGIDVTDTGVDRGSTDAANLHPDFIDGAGSRLLYVRDYTSEGDGVDNPGHGTLNMSIAAGSNLSTDKAVKDSAGFAYGIGIAPFALLGASKIFEGSGAFGLSDPYTKLLSEAYRDGARISSNSWGDGANEYTIESQEYDTRTRDAAPAVAGNQELVVCFASGNNGPGGFVSSLAAAKNVIGVGASESTRKGGVDGCNVKDADADNVLDIASFSSSGPLDDGRIKPDCVAPGTHVQGAASQSPGFNGTGICGLDFDKPYFPENQTLYSWSSGTSHSTPQVAGAAALVRQFFLNRSQEPSAALVKALILNTTTYMNGVNAGGNLPQDRQGWGLLNIDRAFDSVPKVIIDQTKTFVDSGEQFVITGEVKDSTQPFRVTLAWTDSPGFSAFAPWVNDLDLEVVINGQVYRGNNFKGPDSQPGGVADTKNNVEAVWLPAGVVGSFVVRVRASNIAGDGVPGNLDSSDQDFALVVYNGEQKDVPVAGLVSISTTGGPDTIADPGESVTMKVTLTDLAATALTAGHGTLTSKTTGVSVTSGSSDFPNISFGQNGESTSAFTFAVDRSVACGTSIQFVLDVASGSSSSRVLFNVTVGRIDSQGLFSDGIEAGETNWTHASALKKKKKKTPIDTWSVSTRRAHSGSHSWFSSDPGVVVDAHLDSIQIAIPADLKNVQLVFFHTFAFESIGTVGFDGGVLEVSTGSGFEDLGSKILSGGYNGSLFANTQNPLTGHAAWIAGRFGALQQVVVDMSSFVGKTVTIRFRMVADETGSGAGWFVDDVSLRGDRITCLPATE